MMEKVLLALLIFPLISLLVRTRFKFKHSKDINRFNIVVGMMLLVAVLVLIYGVDTHFSFTIAGISEYLNTDKLAIKFYVDNSVLSILLCYYGIYIISIISNYYRKDKSDLLVNLFAPLCLLLTPLLIISKNFFALFLFLELITILITLAVSSVSSDDDVYIKRSYFINGLGSSLLLLNIIPAGVTNHYLEYSNYAVYLGLLCKVVIAPGLLLFSNLNAVTNVKLRDLLIVTYPFIFIASFRVVENSITLLPSEVINISIALIFILLIISIKTLITARYIEKLNYIFVSVLILLNLNIVYNQTDTYSYPYLLATLSLVCICYIFPIFRLQSSSFVKNENFLTRFFRLMAILACVNIIFFPSGGVIILLSGLLRQWSGPTFITVIFATSLLLIFINFVNIIRMISTARVTYRAINDITTILPPLILLVLGLSYWIGLHVG